VDSRLSNVPINTSFSLQIYRYLWQTVDFVYPPSCSGCDKPGNIWCTDCQDKVKTINGKICPICGTPETNQEICPDCQKLLPSYTALRSWAEFEGPVREALHKLKYKNDLAVGYVFSLPLIQLIETAQWDFDLVIPMPISKSHQKSRGYNQAAMIAKPIALAFRKPISNKAVSRIKETKSQIDLSREERFKNLQSAFLGNSATLIGKKVLLVDDITTTGATMLSCSQALKEAGCEKVYCITVARTIKQYQ
jgi:ComF family protein